MSSYRTEIWVSVGWGLDMRRVEETKKSNEISEIEPIQTFVILWWIYFRNPVIKTIPDRTLSLPMLHKVVLGSKVGLRLWWQLIRLDLLRRHSDEVGRTDFSESIFRQPRTTVVSFSYSNPVKSFVGVEMLPTPNGPMTERSHSSIQLLYLQYNDTGICSLNRPSKRGPMFVSVSMNTGPSVGLTILSCFGSLRVPPHRIIEFIPEGRSLRTRRPFEEWVPSLTNC